MHEIVRHIYAFERADERGRVEDISLHNRRPLPYPTAQMLWSTGQASHGGTLLLEYPEETPADISCSSCEQNAIALC
jgi:hypothetical protein